MAAQNPPAHRYWHQGFGRITVDGDEIVVFDGYQTMLIVLARSMLCGFIVEPVFVEYDEGYQCYGFRKVPKSQIKKAKKARPHYSSQAAHRLAR